MSEWPQARAKVRTSFGRLTRSELMSRIRSKGNKTTELALAELFRKSRISGWRRHMKLVGRPDFAFSEARLVVFVDGCFWHGHGCGRNFAPRNNREEWVNKFAQNKARDRANSRKLRMLGWSVIRIWECSLRKNPQAVLKRVKRKL